jgi:hypothetical protein
MGSIDEGAAIQEHLKPGTSHVPGASQRSAVQGHKEK